MTEPAGEETPPPFLGSWRNVYLLVLGELVLTVLVLALVTRWVS